MRVILFLFISISSLSFSQSDTTIYEVQDIEPEFPGGFVAMMSYVQESIMDRTFTAEEATCFSSIFIEFVVEKDGSVSNVKAKNKCNSDLSHFEKVFLNSPTWEPGKRKGQIIRSRYRIPLTIDLN